MLSKRWKTPAILVLIGLLFVAFGIFLMIQNTSMKPMKHFYNNAPDHYPNIAGSLGAPDGTYEVEIIRVFNDSTVQMPLCEHSFGQLHGVWRFDNHTVVFHDYPIIHVGYFNLKFDFPTLETYEVNWKIKHYCVALRDNLIVEARELKE